MCIAITKPIGVALPSETILKNCWYNNDDGAGFSFNHEGRVFIKKGYMTFDAFMSALNDCKKQYDLKNKGMLIHFRIATHGAKDATMTHPFPIVDDAGCLKKIEYISDYAVVHNGIISLTSSDATKSKVLSDTAVFIKDYLTKISKNKAWLRKQSNIDLIEKLIDSKMAVLDRYGNIKMTSGFTEVDGIFYSNSTYLDTYYRYRSTAKPNSWHKTSMSQHPLYGCYNDYDWYNDYDGYADDEYYQESIAHMMDDSKVSDGYMPLMQARVGQFVDIDGYSDQVSISHDFTYFLSESGSFFIVEDNSKVKEYVYVGEGSIYNPNFEEVDFKPSKWVAYKDLIGY